MTRTLIEPGDVEVGMTIESVFTSHKGIECIHRGLVVELLPPMAGYAQVRLDKARYTEGPTGGPLTRDTQDEGDCRVRLGSSDPTVDVKVFRIQ